VAVANIAIEVNGQQAANALKQITTASRQLESAVGTTTTKINNQNSATSSASNQLKNYSKSTQVATAATNGLRGAVTNLLGAFTAVSAAKFVFAKTAELESQTKSLEVLTGSVTKARTIIQELQQLGAVTPFTSTELIDSAKRLNAFGVEGDKVVETTRRLADVAGATGAELQGLVTAYGQVQAKGRLQGEELLQFQERGVALQEELRKMYGLSGEEFQKALSKGRISAEAVEVAVKRLTDAGGKYANGAIAQSDTLQGKFSTLTDGVEQLARTIGVVLTPALKAIFDQAIQVINVINAALAAGRGGGFARNLAGATGAINLGATSEGVDRIAKGIGQISSQRNKAGIQQNLQYLTNYQTVLQRINTQDPNANRAVQLQGVIQQKIQQNLAAQQQLNKAQGNIFKPTAIPALLAETGGGKRKGKSAAERAAEKAAREAARLAEQTKQQLDAAYKLNALAAADLDIQMSMTKEETLQGQFDKAALERRIKFLDLQKSAKSESERQSLASAQLSEILIANNKYAKDKKDLLEQQTRELYNQLDVSGVLDKTLQNRLSGAFMGGAATGGFRTDINLDPNKQAGKVQEYVQKAKTDLADVQGMIVSLATTVEGSIGTAMSNAISGVIAGTATVKDAFASMFKSIGDAFIQMATQMIAKALIMKVLGILGGAVGGGGFGANNYSGAFGAGSSTAFNPGAFGGGMNFFADGGFVNRPTNAMIGEGGQPEYVIPASKMRESMGRYAAGARGAAVIGGGNGGGDTGGGTATMAGSSIDVRYTVERINTVDYVTADQFQTGMRQAASQGAAQGEQRTLRRLQQSPSTRRRVGM
jgi:tape measure domain-containing protein